jgi:hypothetical protein
MEDAWRSDEDMDKHQVGNSSRKGKQEATHNTHSESDEMDPVLIHIKKEGIWREKKREVESIVLSGEEEGRLDASGEENDSNSASPLSKKWMEIREGKRRQVENYCMSEEREGPGSGEVEEEDNDSPPPPPYKKQWKERIGYAEVPDDGNLLESLPTITIPRTASTSAPSTPAGSILKVFFLFLFF